MFLCIGAGVATSTDILTVKPSLPKNVKVFNLSNDTNHESVNRKIIIEYYKQGYILKTGWYEEGSGSIVVMEKY